MTKHREPLSVHDLIRPSKPLESLSASIEDVKREVAANIHSCSYYCDRPECIKSQRDRFRDREWVGLTDEERWGIREWQEIQKS